MNTSEREPSKRRLPHWEYLAGFLIGALWLLLALDGAHRLSVTIDEVPHLGSGYAMLAYGDLRFNPEHPPLAKALFALPVWLFAGIELPALETIASWSAGDQWSWGYRVLFHGGTDPARTLFLGRLMPILLGLLGGLIAWGWGAEIGGRRAGLIAFFLLLWYPEYLGHARYATFDVATLVGCGAVSLAGWRWWKRPSTMRLLLFAAAAGVGSLLKLPVAVFSALLLLLLAVIWSLNHMRQKRYTSAPPVQRVCSKRLAAAFFLVSAGIFVAQWVGAGMAFRTDRHPPLLERPNVYVEPPPDVAEGRPLVALTGALHQLGLLPESAIASLNVTSLIQERMAFLLGDYSPDGYLHYFLVTVLLKTPIVYLIGGIHGLLLVWKRMLDARTFRRERAFVLVTPFLALFFAVVASGVNIGHRHVLFIYLPWCVVLGMILAKWTHRRGFLRGLAILILSLAATSALRTHPFQATYFNTLVGHSPKNARHILSDSNVDWGESLGPAVEALRRSGFRHANLYYFGMADPKAAGLEGYSMLTRGFPLFPPGVYRDHAGPMNPAWPTIVSLNLMPDFEREYGTYARSVEPVAINSVLVYPPPRRALTSPEAGKPGG